MLTSLPDTQKFESHFPISCKWNVLGLFILTGLNKKGNLFVHATKKFKEGTSLVAQWLRIRLPMQGTRVRALVREDPTGHGATKPVRLEPMLRNKRSPPLAATRESPQQQRRPNAAKTKI